MQQKGCDTSPVLALKSHWSCAVRDGAGRHGRRHQGPWRKEEGVESDRQMLGSGDCRGGADTGSEGDLQASASTAKCESRVQRWG